MQKDPGKPQAVIWDMDGLLLDTERLSFLAWQQGATDLGLCIDAAIFHQLIGRNGSSIKETLAQLLGAEADVVELARIATLRYEAMISEGAPLKPGAQACLETLSALQVPQALATSSSARYATKKLGHHQLLDHFQAVVTGDQVTRSKPNPEPYLLAAELLEIEPTRCLAFEDSVNGIRSAYEAGMRPILIPDLSPHDATSLARVWRQFDSLEDALPFLRELFS